jgi:hypothetical protein
VGAEAAADPRPAVLERHDLDAVVELEREVVAAADDGRARLLEPLRRLARLGGWLGVRPAVEQRGPLEAVSPTARAGRYLVALVQGDREATGLAAERAGPRQGSYAESFHQSLLGERDCADLNDLWPKIWRKNR